MNFRRFGYRPALWAALWCCTQIVSTSNAKTASSPDMMPSESPDFLNNPHSREDRRNNEIPPALRNLEYRRHRTTWIQMPQGVVLLDWLVFRVYPNGHIGTHSWWIRNFVISFHGTDKKVKRNLRGPVGKPPKCNGVVKYRFAKVLERVEADQVAVPRRVNGQIVVGKGCNTQTNIQ